MFGRMISILSRKGMLSSAREVNFYSSLDGFCISEGQWR